VSGFDVQARLLEQRIVLVGRALDDELASELVAQLMVLQSQGPDEDVSVYINCPGGPVRAFLALYDAMQSLKSDVHTVCTGAAGGQAAILLAGGTHGKRASLPHARIVLQQPSHPGIQGSLRDVQVRAQEFLRERELLLDIYSRHTGRPKEQIEREIERDYYMTPREALEWGLIDGIVERP
jgi:ATP-dependent Clp protease, protease subunit